MQNLEPKTSNIKECGITPTQGALRINEILFAVPEGDSGDANQDGFRDAQDDEFIEIVNTTAELLSLAGVKIENGSKVKFAFASTCLKPHAAIVVFGGGSSPISNSIISNRSFSFSNRQGTARLTLEDIELDRVKYFREGPSSIVRSPEISGALFIPHRPMLFSPGFCANGRSFESQCGRTF